MVESLRIEIQVKTCVKFCLPALYHCIRFLMGRAEGKNGSCLAIRMNIHQFFFIYDPLVSLKKGKDGPEAMPKFMIAMCILVCCIFATVSVLRSTHCVP